MSTAVTAAQAVQMVPGWLHAKASISELGGGLTNRSYRIDIAGQSFVLRLDDAHTHLFDLDRKTELSVLAAASSEDLAPQVIHADPEPGILVSRFVAGSTWTVNELGLRDNIDSLAELLRGVHSLPQSGVTFDAVAIARTYAQNLRADPELHSFATVCVDSIAAMPGPESLCCCHNDVVLANVIGLPRPVLLDWEYACDNDPMFDLASLIRYHDLPDSLAATLLDAYAGVRATAFRERLGVQLRLYDALQWLWFANRQLASPDSRQAERLRELQQRI